MSLGGQITQWKWPCASIFCTGMAAVGTGQVAFSLGLAWRIAVRVIAAITNMPHILTTYHSWYIPHSSNRLAGSFPLHDDSGARASSVLWLCHSCLQLDDEEHRRVPQSTSPACGCCMSICAHIALSRTQSHGCTYCRVGWKNVIPGCAATQWQFLILQMACLLRHPKDIAPLGEMAGVTCSIYRMPPGWDYILNRNVLWLKQYTHPSEVSLTVPPCNSYYSAMLDF